MASITATVRPGDDISTIDFPDPKYGRIAGFRLDGIQVFLGGAATAQADDEIVATATLLIGVLVGLRDAAQRRINVHDAQLADWAPGEIQAVYGK